MENCTLYVQVHKGNIFQIWESIEDGKFFCGEAELNQTIKSPQDLANTIYGAITDPHLLFNQSLEKGLIDNDGIPTVITISDEKVLFTKGDIETISYDSANKQIIVAMKKSKNFYYFSGVEAVTFLNHFPFSFFEHAETLAEIYKFNLPS